MLFRRLVLPSLGRKHGWRVRTGRARAPRDLPGDGRRSWETPLPGTACEFVGTYRGHPVHGVEYAVRQGDPVYDSVSQTWSGNRTTYSVVTVATTDRRMIRPHNGDPMALYRDFAEHALNRRTESRENIRREDHGMRSISWRGRLRRGRLLRALDELTS